MVGIGRFCVIVMAGSLMLPLAACSRTSDGTIVVDKPAGLPSFNLTLVKPVVPSWMRRKQAAPEPAIVSRNFPPPPASRTVVRRKTRPPVVVTSGSGDLACKNVSEGGRVRMVCQ